MRSEVERAPSPATFDPARVERTLLSVAFDVAVDLAVDFASTQSMSRESHDREGHDFSRATPYLSTSTLSFRSPRSRKAARRARNPLVADSSTTHLKEKDRVERTLLFVALDVDVAFEAGDSYQGMPSGIP
jgi:hypothetical protein